MVTDLAGLARKVDAFRADLDGASLRRITTSVGVDAKRDVTQKVTRDLGSDLKMSGWGRFKFTAGFDLTSDHSLELKPRPVGPWFVLDRGRQAKPAGLPKRRRHKVYATPHGPRTASKTNPWPVGPTRGHNTWSDAVDVIARETPARIDRHTQTVIARHFGRG